MKTDMYAIAEENDLVVVETTSQMNGYPTNIKKAIIGFDSYEQAEKLAGEYNLDIEIFERRAGWNLWYRTGNSAYEEFNLSADTFGYDFIGYSNNDLDEFFENEVRSRVAECEDFDELQDFVESMEEIRDKIENCGDNELVLLRDNEYYDTIEVSVMDYEYDSHYYAIGLIDRKDYDEEDDD